jgi:hypothetical protein
MPEKRISDKIRQTVVKRARGCCEYCRSQMRYSPDPLSVEHIVPRASGGGNEPTNLALSCQGCNNLKYISTEAPDPITGILAPLFHPRRHRWSEHFAWSEDFTLMVGRTPTGRATIERLQLNREGAISRHPPEEP